MLVLLCTPQKVSTEQRKFPSSSFAAWLSFLAALSRTEKGLKPPQKNNTLPRRYCSSSAMWFSWWNKWNTGRIPEPLIVWSSVPTHLKKWFCSSVLFGSFPKASDFNLRSKDLQTMFGEREARSDTSLYWTPAGDWLDAAVQQQSSFRMKYTGNFGTEAA